MNPHDTPPSPYETLVQADTLVLLFKQSFPALFYSLGISCLLCWTLWGNVPSFVLLTWLGALGIGSMLRMAMFLKYFHARPSGAEVLRWQWPYSATLLLSGGIWGIGGLCLMANGTEVARLIVLFFIVGMTAGGVVTYSAHRGMTIMAILAVMAPSILWLYTQPGRSALGMALAGTLFLLGALRGTKVLGDAMHNQIRIGYQLNQAHETAQKLARSDELTGLNNRRAFIELGESLVRVGSRNGSAVSCVLIDIDFFKKVNDVYGHSAGDTVLRHVGTLLVREFRASDICGRLGGEEFAVVLPDTDPVGASVVAERFRNAVATHEVPWQERSIQVTVSIGIASGQAGLTDLLHHADMAMYEAKAAGRNRVVCHSKDAG
jgi:diguanylate cyclase (GGDEF)-like protein